MPPARSALTGRSGRSARTLGLPRHGGRLPPSCLCLPGHEACLCTACVALCPSQHPGPAFHRYHAALRLATWGSRISVPSRGHRPIKNGHRSYCTKLSHACCPRLGKLRAESSVLLNRTSLSRSGSRSPASWEDSSQDWVELLWEISPWQRVTKSQEKRQGQCSRLCQRDALGWQKTREGECQPRTRQEQWLSRAPQSPSESVRTPGAGRGAAIQALAQSSCGPVLRRLQRRPHAHGRQPTRGALLWSHRPFLRPGAGKGMTSWVPGSPLPNGSYSFV